MATRKIRGKWFADFRYQNKRYRLKSPINTKNAAQEFEHVMLSRLIKGEPIKENEADRVITLKEFSKVWFDSYVTAHNRPSEIRRKRSVFAHSLIPFFGDMALHEITCKHVEDFKVGRLKNVSSKTLRNEVSMLSTCLKTAVEWEYLDRLPAIKMPKVAQNGFRWLSEIDAGKLLESSEGTMKDMVFLALKTGLRFGELIAIEWPDFDFDNKRLTINKSIVLGKLGPTKNGKVRYIPLTDSVCEYFRGKKKGSGLAFHDGHGGIMRQKRCSYYLERTYRKAGLNPLGWHALRHTFASHLACKGASILAIKDLLGHSDIKTTMRYAHLGPTITSEAMKLLA